MHTSYGKDMPGHCALFIDAQTPGGRRLSCFKLDRPQDDAQAERIAVRFGAPGTDSRVQRLVCTCAPVVDYSGRQVARVGLFAHAGSERPFVDDQPRAAAELARLISMRLGHVPPPSPARGAGS
jgi:hypothetical protein